MLYAILAFFCLVLFYKGFRTFFPKKEKVIEDCYRYILDERNRYKRTYEFMPRNIEKRFQREVRGVTKYNSKQIASAVIQKLIDNNVIEQIPDLFVDKYRTIHIEQKRTSSTIKNNESNS
jgi:F0F1-type ATP synthase membrane subunit b/b'